MMNSGQLLTKIKNRQMDAILKEIYGNEESVIANQRLRYCQAIVKYIELYGEGDIEIYCAPGRTEICGNHTDHQHGRVLAASINLDAIAVAGKNAGYQVDFVSQGYPAIHIDANRPEPLKEELGTTAALIKGVIHGMMNHGFQTGGFQAYVTSDVLSGSGLSSSAALESLIGSILSGLYNASRVSPVDIALIGQYAENVYFGKPSGLMDQIACSVGDFVLIDFKEFPSPDIRKINCDLSVYGYRLCIVDTNSSHAGLTDDYAAIPAEMKEVSDFFGKTYLREVAFNDFLEKLPELRGKISDRAILRALHFFTENDRVLKAANALENDRFHEFLNVIRESGNSSCKYLQNIYSGSCEHLQPISTALALSEHYLRDHGVCRIHGGGFAGTIQAFVKDEAVAGYKQFIEKNLGQGCCHVLSIRKQGGIRVF